MASDLTFAYAFDGPADQELTAAGICGRQRRPFVRCGWHVPRGRCRHAGVFLLLLVTLGGCRWFIFFNIACLRLDPV